MTPNTFKAQTALGTSQGLSHFSFHTLRSPESGSTPTGQSEHLICVRSPQDPHLESQGLLLRFPTYTSQPSQLRNSKVARISQCLWAQEGRYLTARGRGDLAEEWQEGTKSSGACQSGQKGIVSGSGLFLEPPLLIIYIWLYYSNPSHLSVKFPHQITSPSEFFDYGIKSQSRVKGVSGVRAGVGVRDKKGI